MEKVKDRFKRNHMARRSAILAKSDVWPDQTIRTHVRRCGRCTQIGQSQPKEMSTYLVEQNY